jgi:RNA polymerase sigma-70 factor (ECF subfamily)
MSSESPDFTTMHWSVVLASAQRDSPQAAVALEQLCRTYWYPLYAFVRRQGHSPHDAEDLLQGFFARFLEKNYLNDVDRSKGRFRSFLLAALKHFLAGEWDKAHAAKRGGQA